MIHLLFVLLSPFLLQASVNPVDRQFSETHQDYGSPFLAFNRNYHSGRAGSGLFGLGWCTPWESRLKISGRNAEFSFCGMGKTVRFSKMGNYWSSSDPGYVFVDAAGGYTLNLSFRGRYQFDRYGQLRMMRFADSGVQLDYAEGRLSKVRAGKESADFIYEGSLVKEIALSSGAKLVYSYEDGRLVSVRSNDVQLFKYAYHKNLIIQIKFIKAAAEKNITYADGRVTTISYGTCRESLRSIADGRSVEVSQACAGEAPTSKTFKITGQSRNSQMTILETGKGIANKTTWHRGRIVESDSLDTGVYTYTYDDNGLMKTMSGRNLKISIAQRDSGRVRDLVIQKDKFKQHILAAWHDDQISQLRLNDLDIKILQTPGHTAVIGQKFQLSLDDVEGGGQSLKGSWEGRVLPSVRMDQDLNVLDSTQLKALAKMSDVLDLKNKLEKL